MKNQEQTAQWIKVFQRLLPSPFTIAILLTFLTLLIAQFFTKPDAVSHPQYFLDLVQAWKIGLWDSSAGGLYFAFQMMLILVLGHILALTPAVNQLIQSLLGSCRDTASSAVVVAMGAIVFGLINWGLGLIFGAIMARKVGEKFAKENKPLNYGLIGAAGYSTMMVWHGGLSGSATTKSMEEGYIPEMMQKVGISGTYPGSVPFDLTIGSSLNIIMALACLILIPLLLYGIAKTTKNERVPKFKEEFSQETTTDKNSPIKGAERLDYSKILGIGLGMGIVLLGIYEAWNYQGASSLGFIQLNFINFVFLGLGLILHQNIQNFSNALQTAIGDVSGILIQFPFYFGILALMQSSGLIVLFSDSITAVANSHTLPLFTFISAGLVNLFVPSGGGQWAIQGPIVIETANQLNASLPKTILAMAYGDQWTNMLQPFWALPLLGITKLKPQQVLPYSFLIFILGLIIFGLGLWLLP